MKQNILPVNDVCLYQITHSLTVDVEKKTLHFSKFAL